MIYDGYIFDNITEIDMHNVYPPSFNSSIASETRDYAFWTHDIVKALARIRRQEIPRNERESRPRFR